ncbi:polysaccharide biosynthesis protein [Spirochaetia bacterium]|nr:polysaccharide biosynthesis protein [Spirochaetia bacterium]
MFGFVFKLLHIISYFVQELILFGPDIAYCLVLYPHLNKYKSLYEQNVFKHRIIKKYLLKKYRKVIKPLIEKENIIDGDDTEPYPIWVYWGQGEDSMPALVRICYNSILKNSNGHTVHLITDDNYKEYTTIPEYILKKKEKKIISITHFSDILRMCLLYEHGGLWLDATVLLTRPLPTIPPLSCSLGFYTPKDNGLATNALSGADNWIVRENRWMTFCIYMNKGNLLADAVKKLFFEYWRKEKKFIEYFLFDYLIVIAYDCIPEIRIMVDSVPENNPGVHDLQLLLKLKNVYNEALFNELCSNTYFHKLTYKGDFKEYTPGGKITYYGYLLKQFS